MPLTDEERINDLYQHLYRLINKGVGCDHTTLRPTYLPCPHPECYSPPPDHKVLYYSKGHAVALRWREDYAVDPTYHNPVEVEMWEVGRFTLEGETLYGWRRLSRPLPNMAWIPVR